MSLTQIIAGDYSQHVLTPEMDLLIPLATRVRTFMREEGLSLRSMGEVAGVHFKAVDGWLKGAMPQPRHAVRLAKLFNVPVSAIFQKPQAN